MARKYSDVDVSYRYIRVLQFGLRGSNQEFAYVISLNILVIDSGQVQSIYQTFRECTTDSVIG